MLESLPRYARFVFTGLVEAKGVLVGREPAAGGGARLTVDVRALAAAAANDPLVIGESIAVEGCCLTVVTRTEDGTFTCDASAETLARTTLGALPVGAELNLERATPLGGRMGGHLVTGHVDAVGTVLERVPVGDSAKLVFGFPPSLARLVAEKGSVAVNGVSLTVNGVGADRFDVVVIPHTRAVTTLDALTPGARVNLEADVLARYVLRARDVDAATDR